VLVERCFQSLDHERIRFNDPTGRCTVASAGAAAMGIGICILAAPEIAAGAVVIIGAVVVAVAIQEALDAYELSRHRPEEAGAAPETALSPQQPVETREPEPKQSPLGEDWLPPEPPESWERERRPECKPRRVPPKGGNKLHNQCADGIKFNAYRGANALVNGKAFDALQVVVGVLWEVKTDNFDAYPLELQDIVVRKHVRDFLNERELARACGFDFRVGVRSAAHKKALEYAEPTLENLIVVMDWC
jgi:hypothetical protein